MCGVFVSATGFFSVEHIIIGGLPPPSPPPHKTFGGSAPLAPASTAYAIHPCILHLNYPKQGGAFP